MPDVFSVYGSVNGSIVCGDIRDVVKIIPENSIDMCITSPPYWGLRSYDGNFDSVWDEDKNCSHIWRTNKRHLHRGSSKSKKLTDGHINELLINSNFCQECGAWKGSLGLEPTFQLYVKHICDIFDLVYKILKPTGTCWLNLGDTYNGNKKGNDDPKNSKGLSSNFKKVKGNTIKSKCLINIPNRVAIEMTERGWVLRNEIIWHRPNQMPSSAKDRFTVDFEKLFFFTKQEKYYFETQYEPYQEKMNRWGGEILEVENKSDWDDGTGQTTHRTRNMRPNEKGRNKRTVWSINTKPFKGAHFAKFPPELVTIPILSGCPENGIIIDPFFGSGTTGEECIRLNRKFIGVDISKDYCENVSKDRIITAENKKEK